MKRISGVNADAMSYTELICIGFQTKVKSRHVRGHRLQNMVHNSGLNS